jgi:hypothetical protein
MIREARAFWLLAAMLAGAVAHANANIIADPGFESGTPWLLHGGHGRRLGCYGPGRARSVIMVAPVAATPAMPIQECKWPFWIGAIPLIRSLRL